MVNWIKKGGISMDSSLSLSGSISKRESFEDSELSAAYFEDLKGRQNNAISNEQIRNGDLILDTYKVTSEAVSGGMGSVWRVHHNGWNVSLAMKRPQPRFFAEGGDRKKKQFVGECENWINLGLHPNIVSCYYVREIGGVPTIFSEWMDNGSLSDRIKDGSLYEGSSDEVQERILDIAIQSARGLRYSHENGLLHQDMKPGNLLLTGEWDAKVADFGLSRARSQLGGADSAGTGGYTLAYCPAEQAKGQEPARWMDIYAWALTVLEMYAGSRLWSTGAEAKDSFDSRIPLCRCIMPGELIPVLKSCLTDKPDSFSDIERRLTDVYRLLTGSDYARPAVKASDTADLLNNRALSYIDLGMPGSAEAFWKEALSANPNHLNTVYNYGLYEWYNGRIDDVDFRERLESVFHQQNSQAADTGALLGRIDMLRDDLCCRIPDCQWFGGHHPAALSSQGSYLYMTSYADIFNDFRGHEPIDKRETKTGVRVWRSVSSTKFQKSHGIKLDSGLRMMAVSPDGKFLALIGENGAIEIWETEKPSYVAEKKLFNWFEMRKLKKELISFYDTSDEGRSYAEFAEDNSYLAGRLYGRTFMWKFLTDGSLYANDSSDVFYCPSRYCQDIAAGRVYSPDGSKYLGLTGKENACIFPAELPPLKKLIWELSVIESFSAARDREKQTDKLFRHGREALSKNDIAGALESIEKLREMEEAAGTEEFFDLNLEVGKYCEVGGVNKIQVTRDQTYTGPDFQKILAGIDEKGKTASGISPDGTLAAVGEEDGSVSVWETESGKMLWRKKVHEHEVSCVCISRDNFLVASSEYGGAGTDYRTEKIAVCDARIGRERESFSYEELYFHFYNEEWNPFSPNQHITSLAFNWEVNRLGIGNAQGSIGIVRLYNSGYDRFEAAMCCGGKEMGNRILGLAFGADNKYIWSLDTVYSDVKDPVTLRLWKKGYTSVPLISTKIEVTDETWAYGCVMNTVKKEGALRLYSNSGTPGPKVSYTVYADYIYT